MEMDSKSQPATNKIQPEGCRDEDEDLLAWVRGTKCPCGGKKENFQTFCRDCYKALPYKTRLELWRPWKDGFAKVYSECILYLEHKTTRFLSRRRKGTSLPPTSTLSSGKGKKEPTGQRSPKAKASKSVYAQEISQYLDNLIGPSTNTSSGSVTGSTKSSTSQGTTNITEVIRQTSSGDSPLSKWLSDLL